jgi:hypothetical protein
MVKQLKKKQLSKQPLAAKAYETACEKNHLPGIPAQPASGRKPADGGS